jgi:diguanylate cyclase (GGDEF)-like protein
MELRLYLRMLRSGWWIIALTMLSALAITLTAAYVDTPLYRASARFIISPNSALQSSNEILYSLDTLDRRSIVTTYSEVLNSQRLYDEVDAALNVTAGARQVYTRRAVVLPEANILELSVVGPDPQVATQLANTMGEHAIDYINSLYKRAYDLSFLDPATTPDQPISPQPLRDAGLALTLGLVFGAVLAILSEQLRIPLQALRRLAQIDGSSSAYTRRYFQRCLNEEVQQRRNPTISLALVHLEGLQEIIELQPHATAQRVLRQITQTLRSELRSNDVVGRWGDTCFALLLPSTPGPAAVRTLSRLRTTLAKPLDLTQAGEVFSLSPYAGVTFRQSGETPDELVGQAEAALERARQTDTQVFMFTVEQKVLSKNNLHSNA